MKPSLAGTISASTPQCQGNARRRDTRAGRWLSGGTQSITLASWRSDIEILRVSGTSRPNSVAGAIAALLRTAGEVEVQAIGPHAVNQAVKAIAISRSYIEAEGLGLHTVPSFVKLELHEEERTAVRFLIESFTLAGEEGTRSSLAE